MRINTDPDDPIHERQVVIIFYIFVLPWFVVIWNKKFGMSDDLCKTMLEILYAGFMVKIGAWLFDPRSKNDSKEP